MCSKEQSTGGLGGGDMGSGESRLCTVFLILHFSRYIYIFYTGNKLILTCYSIYILSKISYPKQIFNYMSDFFNGLMSCKTIIAH